MVTPEIYEHLEGVKQNLNGKELVYTLGIQSMIDAGLDVHALELKNAKYRDTGNKLEYLKTLVEYGLKHPEFGEEFKEFLKKLS